MTIKKSKKETVQKYSDRFTSLMRRSGKRDDDDTLIAVYIDSLDPRLQEIMHDACATNLSTRAAQGIESVESVSWKIQNAIALDAAHNGTPEQKLGDAKHQKPRCGKSKKLGHTTAEHREDYLRTPTKALTSRPSDRPRKSALNATRHGSQVMYARSLHRPKTQAWKLIAMIRFKYLSDPVLLL